MCKHLFFLFLFVIFAVPVFSQSKKSSDDVTPYGGLENPGYISASLGLSFGSVRGNLFINTLALEGKSNDYMLPEVNVEVGLVDRISIELITGYRKIVSKASLSSRISNRTIKANKTSDGLNPIMLGLNLGLFNEHKMLPGMNLSNEFYIPKTGYSNFRNEQLGFVTTLNMENNVSDVTCLDYSLGAGWDGNSPYPVLNFNINPNFDVADNIVAYFELGGNYSKYQPPVNLIDIGTNISFSDLFSIDAMIGNELQTKNFAKSSFGALKFTFDFNAFGK
ncbi:MAG: transporter [Ignavibacteria bacterium]|nr:transporter [Ignavibacteria bacterium]